MMQSSPQHPVIIVYEKTAMELENYTLVKYIEVRQENKVYAYIEWKIIDFQRFYEEDFKELRTDLFAVHEECDCSQYIHAKNIRLKLKKRGQQIAFFFLCVPTVPITSEVTYYNSSSTFTYLTNDRKREHFQSDWQFLDVLLMKTGTSQIDKSLRIELKLGLNFKFPDPEKEIFYIFNELTTLKEHQNMLKDGTYSDVTLVSKDGGSVKAHMKILAKTSEMFKAMFEHDKIKPETDIPTLLDEKTLGEMLTWIYTKVTPEHSKITVDLFLASDYYQLSGLKTICAKALCSQLTVDNAVDTLVLAGRINCKELLKPTLQYITNGLYDLVMKTEGWKNIKCVDTLKLISEAALANDDPLQLKTLKNKIEKEYLFHICNTKGTLVDSP